MEAIAKLISNYGLPIGLTIFFVWFITFKVLKALEDSAVVDEKNSQGIIATNQKIDQANQKLDVICNLIGGKK